MKKLIIVGIIVTMITALSGCSTDKKEEIHIEPLSGGTETIITENIIEENIIEGNVSEEYLRDMAFRDRQTNWGN